MWNSAGALTLSLPVADNLPVVQARPAWGVAGLLLATADALAARFGAVAVRGELSGFSRAGSGHCYFTLKDVDGAAALIRCAMFRRSASLLAFAPADGQQVEVRGRLCVYESRGELQLVVEALERLGAGTLYEEFVRRRARLEAAGVFGSARKRPLPAFPRALGVVTSLGAAALRDVLTALARRAPHVRVVVYPSAVQGADAPAGLMAALRRASERNEVDVLLLVRGGGSLEDLWAFNDERLVHAVAGSALPLVCGVGHETDITLCDLAADLRAPTPTAAAEMAAPTRDALLAQLAAHQAVLQRAAQRVLQAQALRLDLQAMRLGQPARGLGGHFQALQALAARMRRVLEQRRGDAAAHVPRVASGLMRALHGQLQRQTQRLGNVGRQLHAHDPARVLQRGYAWVQSLDGKPVLSVRALRTGQAVQTVWADGRADVEVLRIELRTPP